LKPAGAALAALLLAAAVVPARAGGVDAACGQLAAHIPTLQLEQCRLAGLRIASSATVQSRPLLVRDIPPAAPRAGAPRRVLVLGGIHGDELSAVVVAFQWIERLRNDRFQSYQWRVAPSANPDGLMSQPPQRMNAHGVDLNRNFPAPDWSSHAQSYWRLKTHSDPRRYPGPQAASEPETRWIIEQIRAFKPDAIVSIHAPLSVLDFDGPYQPPPKLGYLRLQPLGVYPGSLGDYAGTYLKLPVLTLELPQAGRPPSAEQSGRMLSDLITWLDKSLH
jgi:murein peptide amidase A